MLRQYFVIFSLYFLAGFCSAQITSFSVLAGADIKALANSIQARKNEGYLYHVLDSLNNKLPLPTRANGALGEVYEAHISNGALYFNASKDGGRTWALKNVFIDSLPNNRNNPFSVVNEFAYTVCNKAMNRIYVCWSDAKFGLKNNDVFLSYSDDGGKTWLDRILITYFPNHKQQFMPRFAIDHSNGYLYLMYCSQRNFASGNLTDVYLAVSKDNGTTFTEYKLNDKPFEWNKAKPLSRYFSLTVRNGNIYPIWTQSDTKKKFVIYSTVLSDVILKNVPGEDLPLDKNVKYVYAPKTKVDLNQVKTTYAVYVYKASDPKFEVCAIPASAKNNTQNFTIDFEKLKLPKGTYVAVLYNNNRANYVWIQEE
jgi:hypothetical protein